MIYFDLNEEYCIRWWERLILTFKRTRFSYDVGWENGWMVGVQVAIRETDNSRLARDPATAPRLLR